MSDLTLHADYQDPSIKYVDTTRAIFSIGATKLYAYNFNNVVLLNLSQAAELVGKQASSLFRFLTSNTLKMAMQQLSTKSQTSYYTTVRSDKGGKPERIVPIEYVTLFWVDQATRANNPIALRLLVDGFHKSAKTDASIALGIIAPLALPTYTKSELYRKLADHEDKLAHAPGMAAKLEAIPVSGYAMIEGKVEMYKIQELLEMLGAVVDPKMYPALSRALGIALVSDGAIQRSMLDGVMVYPLSALPTLKTLLGSVLI